MSFGAGTAETQLSNQEQGAAGQQYNALGTEGSTITGLFNNLLPGLLSSISGTAGLNIPGITATNPTTGGAATGAFTLSPQAQAATNILEGQNANAAKAAQTNLTAAEGAQGITDPRATAAGSENIANTAATTGAGIQSSAQLQQQQEALQTLSGLLGTTLNLGSMGTSATGAAGSGESGLAQTAAQISNEQVQNSTQQFGDIGGLLLGGASLFPNLFSSPGTGTGTGGTSLAAAEGVS